MLKRHSKVVEIGREERKKKREDAKATVITDIEPNTIISPVLRIILPQQNNVSIQTSPELFDAGCQTRTKPIRFLGAPFQVNVCEEVAKSGSTATRFTQTVTVIRNTSWQKIISNPHPDTVQEILSKKKVRKPQLSVHQKAVRWWDCDRRKLYRNTKVWSLLNCHAMKMNLQVTFLALKGLS